MYKRKTNPCEDTVKVYLYSIYAGVFIYSRKELMQDDSSRILSLWDRQAYCLYIRPPQYGSRYTNACRGIPEPLILQKERITTKTITKNKLVALRFRENEYNLIKSKANKANMSFTEFVTRSALNKQITVVDGLPEILKEVKAIGRNLNQLTTLCNMGKIICPELSELKEQYSNAVVMLDEIARRCS